MRAANEVSETSSSRAARLPRAVSLALATLVLALVGGTLALWLHYGTAVFFETIAAGVAACF